MCILKTHVNGCYLEKTKKSEKKGKWLILIKKGGNMVDSDS